MAAHHEENHVGSSCNALVSCTRNNLRQCLTNEKREENQKRGEVNKENNGNWANIPEDVLQLIMRRLSLKDFLGLRAICSAWRAIVSNAISNKHYCHPLLELPLIFLQQTVFSLITEHELCLKSEVLKSKQICVGSIEGWLILSELVGMDSSSITFFNPVTNATILVPPMLKCPYSIPDPIPTKTFLWQMVASFGPNSSSKSDCFLVGVFADCCHIAFCKLSDTSWTIIEAEKQVLFKEVEVIGSKLYVRITINKYLNSMLVYDLLQDSCNPPKPKALAKLPPSPNPIISEFGTTRSVWGIIKLFIAKDDASGELFLIFMFCNMTYEIQHISCLNMITEFVIPPNITSVEVFTMDMKKKETTMEWKRVEDLGDRVLFLSYYKSIVMSRAALNSSNTKGVIVRNSIYFATGNYTCPSNPWEGVEFGKICLTDNNIDYFSVEKSNHRRVPYPCWFVPSV